MCSDLNWISSDIGSDKVFVPLLHFRSLHRIPSACLSFHGRYNQPLSQKSTRKMPSGARIISFTPFAILFIACSLVGRLLGFNVSLELHRGLLPVVWDPKSGLETWNHNFSSPWGEWNFGAPRVTVTHQTMFLN